MFTEASMLAWKSKLPLQVKELIDCHVTRSCIVIYHFALFIQFKVDFFINIQVFAMKLLSCIVFDWFYTKREQIIQVVSEILRN